MRFEGEAVEVSIFIIFLFEHNYGNRFLRNFIDYSKAYFQSYQKQIAPTNQVVPLVHLFQHKTVINLYFEYQ
jgi:hypothetical protein